MSSPPSNARYHSTIHGGPVSTEGPDASREPARLGGVELQKVSFVRMDPPVLIPGGAFPHDRTNSSAIQDTGLASASAGPKFQPDAKRNVPSASRSASMRYPRSGSSTNCQGRIADGFRIKHGSAGKKGPHEIGNQLIAGPVAAADGIAGASAAPARRRAVERIGGKKDSRYAVVTSSAQPFEFEYGSRPPIGSFSRYPQTHSRFS